MVKLNILFVEDLPTDVEIAVREIRKEKISFDFVVVETAAAFREALTEFDPDLVISDYAMPVFDGMTALKITRSQPRYIPFIMLTGSMNEETAVACLKAGADDYVLKEKIKRLPFAVLEVMEKRKKEAERENVLHQLRESEEHLREVARKLNESNRQKELILNSTAEMFAYYDLDLKVIWANHASATSAGKSPEELVGLHCYEIWQHRDKPCENCIVLKAYRTKKPQFGEQQTPDGRYWLLRGYPVFNDRGDIEALIELGMDITGQKKAEDALATSEETYRNLFQNAQVGLFRTRISDGKILEGNDQIAKMFGYSSREAFVAEYTTSGNYVDSGVREKMLELIKKQGFVENFEARFYRKDRSVFHSSYSARIYPDKGWIEGVVEDITEQKLAQENLIAAKVRAEESDRLKSAFLANMSHEIRTPMNSIMGFTELLKEPNLTGEEQQRFIEIIRKSGDRLLNTVNDLIDISRIETGQMPLVFDDVHVIRQLEELVFFFIPQAEQKGLQLMLDVTRSLPHPIIRTDQSKLESILTNLIKNAIKFTETGEIRVGCEVMETWLKFTIKDTGIGIPENRKEAIFNRFEQADISDTRALQGSGLGLSIAKAYAEMLGGAIGVESTEGIGSTFWFTLPDAQLKENPPAKEQASVQRNSPESFQPMKKPKILVAEDDEDCYTYLATLLSESTYELIHTTTGTETVELCRTQPDIDCILMDIKMPIMDGYEATRQIRKFNKEVVIIAQTAYALMGDREKALEAGCNDYLTKPVNKHRLVTIFSKYSVGNIP
jgi:PAS domain S-box-containing protein